MKNKKRYYIFFFLLINFCYLSAERNEYYKNPETSSSLVITRNADLKRFTYTYYILNKFKKSVCGSEETPRPAAEIEVREKFFATVEEYMRPSCIEMKWDYKDEWDKKGRFVEDGVYELHLNETDRKNKTVTNEYVYFITIDTKAPFITGKDCILTSSTVYKNKQDYLALSLKNRREQAHSWEVLLDDRKSIYKEECPYGEERLFPPAVPLQYSDYASLPLGVHELTLIAKDCAGNTSEARISFRVEDYPFNFSIIGNGEVVFKKDGNVKPFFYAGTGDKSKLWKTSIYDEAGIEHFSDMITSDTPINCKRFEWNGISKITQEKAKEGKYTVVLLCKDDAGKEIKQSDLCIVVYESSAARFTSYETTEISVQSALTCSFSNGLFNLKLNRKDTVKAAVLKVIHEDKLLYESDIQDIQNISWDGYDGSGNLRISTGEEYDFVVETTDEQDAQEIFSSHFRTPLIFEDDGEKNRKKVIAKPVYFVGNDAGLLSDNEYFIQNAASLRKTAQAILKQLDNDEVLILAGNANYTTYPNRSLMKKEEAVLLELSRDRAEIVKKAFIFFGIPEHRIKIEANGGKHLLVAPDSKDNWKNRRVEFFIEKAEQ